MSRKLRMDDRFEVFWKFRRKLRRLRISWLKYLISDVRSNYSFVLKINEEICERGKLENILEKITPLTS